SLSTLPRSSSRTRRPPTSTLFPYTTLFRSTRCATRSRSPAARSTCAVSRRRCTATGDGPGRGLLAGSARGGHRPRAAQRRDAGRSEEHTSELQSPYDLVCRLLLEKKKITQHMHAPSLCLSAAYFRFAVDPLPPPFALPVANDSASPDPDSALRRGFVSQPDLTGAP